MADTISDAEVIEALMAFFATQGKCPSREQIMQTLFDLMAEANITTDSEDIQQ